MARLLSCLKPDPGYFQKSFRKAPPFAVSSRTVGHSDSSPGLSELVKDPGTVSKLLTWLQDDQKAERFLTKVSKSREETLN